MCNGGTRHRMYKWTLIQGPEEECGGSSRRRGGVEISEAMSGVKSSGETQVSCLEGGPGEPILADRSTVHHQLIVILRSGYSYG
jgi:hypothetical protein